MPNARHRLGQWAEAEVARWLAGHGWNILAIRHRTPAGEIDLVALDRSSTLVAVEVRLRTSTRTGDAIGSVRSRHLHRVGVALIGYAREAGIAHRGLRIDLVAVTPGPEAGTWRLTRVPNIGAP